MKDVFCFSELLNAAYLQVKTHQALKETGSVISLIRKLLALEKTVFTLHCCIQWDIKREGL